MTEGVPKPLQLCSIRQSANEEAAKLSRVLPLVTFVERKHPAGTSNPLTNPKPTFDVGEVLERILTVERENLQRLDDDIAILTKYLKTQVPQKP